MTPGSVSVGILVEDRVIARIRLGHSVEGLKLALEGARSSGVQAYVFSPSSVENRELIHGFVYEKGLWSEKNVAAPVVLYDRAVFPAKEKAAGKQVRSLLTQWGCIPLNKKSAFGKWKTYQVLSLRVKMRPYLPFTTPYQHPIDFDRFLFQWDSVFLKPVDGRLGKAVIKCQKDENGFLRCSYSEGSKNRLVLLNGFSEIERFVSSFGDKRFILQRGIDLAKVEGRPFDLRVLVQKDGKGEWVYTGVAARKAAPGKAVTNISSGGSALPAEQAVLKSLGSKGSEALELVKKVSLQTAECLDKKYGPLGELGIDIGLDQEGRPWIFEVNGKPAKSSLRRIGAVEAVKASYRHPFEFARYLAALEGTKR